MKAFNLFVKIVAFVLILYIFMQQKGDYYKEIGGKPTTAAPAVVPTKTK